MIPATCLPNNCFCESVRPVGIAQPSDTWSNAAFIILGVLVIATAAADRKKSADFKNFAPYGLFYGLLMIVVGLGSMYYHAKLNFLGQFLDNFGMYLIISAIFFYRIKNFIKIKPWLVLLYYALTNIFLGIIQYIYPETRRYLFALGIILVLITEYQIHKTRQILGNKNLLFSAIGLFISGFAIWIADITKAFCLPDSLLQGHALWHILTALSAALIFLFYRSEVKTT
jgi:dihydroceramidase